MRILVCLFVLLATSAVAQPVKVMTYNIRYDNPGDGPNRWDNRKEKVFALIRKYNPDIIGLQEALHHQLEDFAANLKDYTYFGVGREDGKEKGEYSAVLVRKNRFKVLAHKSFWLSKTPEVVASKDWDAALTRIATWVRLRDKKSGNTFLVINTHFDHRGPESREKSAALLKDRAVALADGLPVIITGDLNFMRDQPPYDVMTDSSKLKVIDAAPSDPPGTFCGFTVDAMPCRAIDYIFYTPQWTLKEYQVIDDNDGKFYPSDHLPVMATLSISEN